MIIKVGQVVEVKRGMSGIFSNQNYAGCWLNIILPFSIALFYEKSTKILKRTI